MAKNFPYSWATWQGGVEEAYRRIERADAGEKLSDQDAEMLPTLRKMVQRYARDGHKKPNVPKAARLRVKPVPKGDR